MNVLAPLRRARRERVRLLVPRLPELEAAVARLVDGAVELSLPRGGPLPTRFLHHRSAALAPPKGEAEPLEGVLLAVPDEHGRIRDDVIHFVYAPTGPDRRPREQRREHVRVHVIRPVAMVPAGFKVGWLTGSTRNLSAGGVLVTGAEQLRTGDRLRIRIELEAEDDLLDARARVARVDPRSGLRGLRFDLGERERERIVRYVFKRQREQLAHRPAAIRC
mgnify:CR=1 FL=1